jgi:diguanylate cyclase (GGDEF)-like protein
LAFSLKFAQWKVGVRRRCVRSRVVRGRLRESQFGTHRKTTQLAVGLEHDRRYRIRKGGAVQVASAGRIAGVVAVLFMTFATMLLTGWLDEHTGTVATGVVAVMAAALAAVSAALAARRADGRLRAAWLALTIGLAGATVASGVWEFRAIGAPAIPTHSPAEAAYLLFPVGVVAAVLLFPVKRNDLSQCRFLLDAVIVAMSLLMVSWLTVTQPAYAEGSMPPVEHAASLTYSVSNAVAFTVAAVVLVRTADDGRLTLLTSGLACMTLAGFAYPHLAVGDGSLADRVIHVGWLAGMLLIALAAGGGLHAAFRPGGITEKLGWVSLLLPSAVLLLAVAVVVVQPPGRLASAVVQVVGTVLVAAALARQVLLIAENRRMVATVTGHAVRDPLTGLANRTSFVDRLRHALQPDVRYRRAVGVIELDLHDFKLINDTLGHGSGDEVLTISAERLLGCVHPGDIVARLGGDRFAVLVEGGIDVCRPVVQKMMAAFERPFMVDGYELLVRLSAGIAVADTDETGVSAEELLRRADVALNSARVSRGGEVRTFSAEMLAEVSEGNPPSRSRTAGGGPGVAQLLGELHRAIERAELTLAYQPMFDAHTHAVVAVEALLRWPHPHRGLLSPKDFLPLVRRHLLMGGITDFVIERALDDAKRWHTAGLDVPVAVNLFAPLLSNLNLPDRIGRALADRGLATSALTVEITEDLFVDDMERTQKVLNELSDRGIKTAIDDFGTGYSALSYLTDLPVDQVKLDRSFVARILADRRAAMVVGVVVDLAHRLGLAVVAEGVDNAELAGRLRDLGCDMLQGYHLSPPLTVDGLLGALDGSKTALGQRF